MTTDAVTCFLKPEDLIKLGWIKVFQNLDPRWDFGLYLNNFGIPMEVHYCDGYIQNIKVLVKNK